MLTILTTIDKRPEVERAIASIERLHELVSIANEAENSSDVKSLVIDSNTISAPLDWYDFEPPYVFPGIEYSKDNLLALVFYKLGNHQKAFEFVEGKTAFYQHLLIATHLQFGYEISSEMLDFTQKTSPHNDTIVRYYGNLNTPQNHSELEFGFEKALETAENDEAKVFTAKHYINMLLDAGELDRAKKSAEHYAEIAISEEAKFAMKAHLAGILLENLKIPYQTKELDEVQELQLDCIAHYESIGLNVQAGLLLIDAAEVANYKENFIASKELINRAIQYFKNEDIPEFLGEAGLKKAILLYTWSKNGHPQYYKAAINAFQDVLKVFKRDTHPQKFADVHHSLALIYSEIPVSPEEKPMWTAFCASSFKEVLAFYTKNEYPYEYAMASHNYATALMHFPPAKIHDNLKKAAGLFEEALQIRTANRYPFERALTLLNQLELHWLTHNENTEEERKKYEVMKSKAVEVKSLVNDESLVAQANEHLKELEKVKSLI